MKTRPERESSMSNEIFGVESRDRTETEIRGKDRQRGKRPYRRRLDSRQRTEREEGELL